MNQIEGLLLQSGFQRRQTNVPQVVIFEQIDKISQNVIVVFDLYEDVGIYPEQYRHISNQIRESYMRDGLAVQYLNILYCRDMEQVRAFAMEDEIPQWMIDTSTQRLIIYENQKVVFPSLKDKIERSLEQGLDETTNESSPRVWNRENIPVCTLALIVFNILVFLVVEATGSSMNVQHMIKWGASDYDKIVNGHQYYRFFTSMFLHFGIEHLFNNMLVLFLMGERLERLLGSKKFLLMYLMTGILSSIGSFVYRIQLDELNVVSAGASGAIFGIVGAITAIVVLHKGRVSDITPTRMAFFVVFSLYIGLKASEVDNAAHISGLVSGIIIMIIFHYFKNKREQRENHYFD